MSHLRELNQKAPFWDWVTEMGGAPPDHPWPQHGHGNNNNNGEGPSNTHADEKTPLDDDTEMAPPDYDGEDPPTPPEEVPQDPFATYHGEKLPDRSKRSAEEGDGDNGNPPKDGPGRRGRGCRHGGPGGPWAHHHPHGHHGHHGPPPFWGRGRGGFRGGFRGGRGPGGFPFGGPGPFGGHFPPGQPPFGPFAAGGWGEGGRNWWGEMAKKFAERFGLDPNQMKNGGLEEGVDFEPAIDVYSTQEGYVVHVALPGAKKEDVGVTWDEGQAALTIAGVVTRGVDEELSSQLAVSERPVGFFKRVVKLGDREHPARVDADTIGAKMEEGVLKINVGKTEEFVELKKVEIE